MGISSECLCGVSAEAEMSRDTLSISSTLTTTGTTIR